MTDWLAGSALIALTGLVIDAVLGWPAPLHARLGHPVTWLGWLISRFEQYLNHGPPLRRLVLGAFTALSCVTLAAGVGTCAYLALRNLPLYWLVGGILCWPLIATRSMWEHVERVRDPVARGDLTEARKAVAMIVGRDMRQADPAAICRAASESLAENASDGIIAPLFWAAIGGLPGIMAYKAINTLDSMIGHRDARYLHFGRVAARLDDLVNLVPARLTALLFAIASVRPVTVLNGAWAEAGHHRSPNAGWPESAMAHALGIRLSGPRRYGDRIADEPWLNGTAPDPDAASLRAGLHLFIRSTALAGLILAAIAVLISFLAA